MPDPAGSRWWEGPQYWCHAHNAPARRYQRRCLMWTQPVAGDDRYPTYSTCWVDMWKPH